MNYRGRYELRLIVESSGGHTHHLTLFLNERSEVMYAKHTQYMSIIIPSTLKKNKLKEIQSRIGVILYALNQ